ncbi:MAG: hypothetical protein CVU81_02295 [Euryarchaeota archaeon HGW-Euryarchaeota-1]|nr:MAG: hypothetical protein CVU81_02295 [Euryarchaeota archaeon HGW-Euryarchaeota-1]
MVGREVSDRTILDEFVNEFVAVLEKQEIKYVIVSGFVAIAHGRARGTIDVDLILEKLSENAFSNLFKGLITAGFECMQSSDSVNVYRDYLINNNSVRFYKKGSFVPEMEVKFAKDVVDNYQLKTRKKLPLTDLEVWFANVEGNIAFKEEYLKSEKDLEDARHLRIIYGDEIDENEIRKIKEMIKEFKDA